MRIFSEHTSLAAIVVGAALVAGCSTGDLVEAPAPDMSPFADIDAIIVVAETNGKIRAPRNVISGRDDGASSAAKDTLRNCCNDPYAVFLLPALVPLSAIIGAAVAQSPGETAKARAVLEGVANDPTLRRSLGSRVSKRIRSEARLGRKCVEVVSASDGIACPSARRPATLLLNAHFWSSGDALGRKTYDPSVRLTGFLEASLTRGEAEPVVMRWRYDSSKSAYFSLVKQEGRAIRAEFDRMLDEMATAVVRDLFLDPRPVSMKMRSGRGVNKAWKRPIGRSVGTARRLMPGEVAPASFSTIGRAAVTTKMGASAHGGCTISAIAGRPSYSGAGTPRFPDGTRIAHLTAGYNKISLMCRHADGVSQERREIQFRAEPRRIYCIDGNSVTETNAPHRC